MKKKSKILFGCIGALLLVLLLTATLFYQGILQMNRPSQEQYPVKGVDVSAYQGEIDWQTLAMQDVSFAFIKATEGSSFVDDKFSENWENALATNLKVGAYHFFSYESSGTAQAEHFIRTVPKVKGSLAPVIDVEFYGDFHRNPANADSVISELKDMIVILEKYYEVKPILYFTQESYELYIKGNFDEYPLWARSVYKKIGYIEVENWSFWQYSNRKKLDGYKGEEKFIDMNCFNGSVAQFETFLQEYSVK